MMATLRIFLIDSRILLFFKKTITSDFMLLASLPRRGVAEILFQV